MEAGGMEKKECWPRLFSKVTPMDTTKEKTGYFFYLKKIIKSDPTLHNCFRKYLYR